VQALFADPGVVSISRWQPASPGTQAASSGQQPAAPRQRQGTTPAAVPGTILSAAKHQTAPPRQQPASPRQQPASPAFSAAVSGITHVSDNFRSRQSKPCLWHIAAHTNLSTASEHEGKAVIQVGHQQQCVRGTRLDGSQLVYQQSRQILGWRRSDCIDSAYAVIASDAVSCQDLCCCVSCWRASLQALC